MNKFFQNDINSSSNESVIVGTVIRNMPLILSAICAGSAIARWLA